MLKDEIVKFLRETPPFHFLSEMELDLVAQDIAIEFYPRGAKILRQGGPPSEFLRIIKKGGVKVFVSGEKGEEFDIDFRGPGEQFGFLSVIGADHSRASVMAVEDTICYLISRDKVFEVLQKNTAVNEYFLRSFFLNFIDKTYAETRRNFTGFADADRQLFTTPVGQIIKKPPMTTLDGTSIQEAASLMSRERISSLIVTDSSGVPLGIVTDRDLRNKVVAIGLPITGPVTNIMSKPLISVDAEENCFEALLRMIRHKIHHIIVIEAGKFKGIVTNHDFMVLQGSAPTALVKEMDDMKDVDELSAVVPKLYKNVSNLVREGARASNVTGLITEVTEKLLIRLIDIVERKLGVSPLPYTVVMMGPGGRRELTLGLDVRLGIVYEDNANLSVVSQTEKYFSGFTTELGAGLVACGIRSCVDCLRSENVKSLSDWIERYRRLCADPIAGQPDLDVFDIRAIHGDEGRIKALRDAMFDAISSHPAFLDYASSRTISNRPPLGFFGKFVVEKSGEHRNELNIYQKGVRPMADVARLFAFQYDVRDFSTTRRLTTLRDRFDFKEAENLQHAFGYLMTMLVHIQLGQIEKGYEPDEFVNPVALAAFERQTLKESFQMIANIYSVIEKGYVIERVE